MTLAICWSYLSLTISHNGCQILDSIYELLLTNLKIQICLTVFAPYTLYGAFNIPAQQQATTTNLNIMENSFHINWQSNIKFNLCESLLFCNKNLFGKRKKKRNNNVKQIKLFYIDCTVHIFLPAQNMPPESLSGPYTCFLC